MGGEANAVEQPSLLAEGYLLWLIVATMALLGSLVGVFTFCVRKKRVADDDVGRRKKSDESTPDDRVLKTQANNDSWRDDTQTSASTTAEGQTHVEVASENGVDPVITEVNKEAETTVTAYSLSEHREGGDAPVINDVKEELEERRETEVATNGIEEVERREKTKPELPNNKPRVRVAVTPSLPNGISEHHTHREVRGEVAMVNGAHETGRWSFPPVLEDFDLMETEADPADLEQIFADERLVEINLELDPDCPGLGISIVGGSGSPSRDLPIIIKRVLPNSLAERDGRLKSGDELIAVNETLLVGVAKDAAIETLSNISGKVRLLVIQDE